MGKKGYDKLWDRPGFRHIRIALSYVYSAFSFVIANISGGKTPLSRLLPAVNWSLMPMMLAAICVGLAFVLYDAGHFFSGVETPLLMWLLYLLQFSAWACFLYLCVRLLGFSFHLPLWKSIAALVLSLGMSGFVSWLVFVYTFGVIS